MTRSARRRAALASLDRFAPDTQLCMVCGYSHAPEFRQAILRRLLASQDALRTTAAIAEAWPCFWGPSEAERANLQLSNRLLCRDLHAIGAKHVVLRWDANGHKCTDASWELPR